MTPASSNLERSADAPRHVGSGHRPGQPDSLSNLRHHLRTPLNQIIGYSELLQEEAADRGQTTFLNDLKKIHTAGRQLLAMVNDRLAPLTQETGRLDLDELFHEMRTPLNLIIGYSELMQEQDAGPGGESLLNDLKRIDTAARNLLQSFDTDRANLLSPGSSAAERSTPAGSTTRRPVVPAPPTESRRSAPAAPGTILLVDDSEMNRDMLARRLRREGHTVVLAENGYQALETLRDRSFDLVLLDIIMPGLDGLQTLEQIKADPALQHLPVIMLSALDQIDSVVSCVERGAEDYLAKPFNPVLLRARINASLEKKRLVDQQRAFLEQLRIEREKSEQLLLNVLPQTIADRLKQGESVIADNFAEASVLFADLVDFTRVAATISAHDLVRLLNDIFSGFDWLAELHHLEKIKTIGDSYMVVAGLPSPRPDSTAAIADMALEMRRVIRRYRTAAGVSFQVRIGIGTGPVVAGIIGRRKFIYDLWGDTVNLASRMESHGQPDRIQVCPTTYSRLRDHYQFEARGVVPIKGKGEMSTYFLTGTQTQSAANPDSNP